MNDNQSATTTEVIQATQQALVDTQEPRPLTNGYVPIVGVPDNPVFVVPDTQGSNTKFTVSALDDSSVAATVDGPVATKACKVNFSSVRQYIWLNGNWSEVTSGTYPFACSFSLNTEEPITDDQQFESSITNLSVGKAKIEITYWVGESATNARGKITFQRG